MIRVEIIANHSVEENILEAFQAEGVAKYYTKFPTVFGVGSSGPRMGDAIWPEENFIIVVWCEKDEAEGIERALATVKQQFPDEGIKLFKMEPAPVPEVKVVTTPQVVVVPPVPPSAGPAWNSAEILSALPVINTPPLPEPTVPAANTESEPTAPADWPVQTPENGSLEIQDLSSTDLADEPLPFKRAEEDPPENPLSRSEQEQLWGSSPLVHGVEDENS